MLSMLTLISKNVKRVLIKIIMLFMSKGIISGSLLDSGVKQELMNWNEGFSFILKSDHNDTGRYICWEGGRLTSGKGKLSEDEADIVICFKNIEAAFMVMTGRISVAKAFAEHRFIMKGDIFKGMSIVRIMNIVEGYLFPPFISRKILKRIPDKEVSSLRMYRHILLGF